MRPAATSLRRLIASAVRALAGAVLVGLVVLPAGAAHASVGTPPGVASSLARSPVYVDPSATSPHVDVARLLRVMPSDTYFAELPRSILSTGGDPAAVPAFLSSQVGRGGTFIVLLEGRLYGASTTIPGRLGAELAAAQSSLPTGDGDATATLVALMRSLAGSGDLQDATGPSRAGGPVGGGLLIAMIVVVAAGALGLWWWLRRPPRRRPRPAPPLRDLVEIDYAGRIIRRTPASERVPPGDSGPDA